MPSSNYTVASAVQLAGFLLRDDLESIISGFHNHGPHSTAQKDGSPDICSRNLVPVDETRYFSASQDDAFSLAESEQEASVDHEEPQPKLCITFAQLGRVMAALVESPLVTGSLQCQRITFDLDAANTGTYSLANKSAANQAAQEESKHLPLVNGEAGGIAVLHTRTEGSPVLYTSNPSAPGSIKIGSPTEVALSYGLESAARLHVRPVEGGVPQIVLQVMHSAIGYPSAVRESLISIERDVTEILQSTAVEELLRDCRISRENFEIKDERDCATEHQPSKCISSEQAVRRLTRAIESDTAETCDLQTLSLISYLRRLRVTKQDIVVLHTTASSTSGQSLVIPAYVSQKLIHELARVPKKAEWFIRMIAAAVQPHVKRTTNVEINDKVGREVLFRCYPLFRSTHGRPSAWAVVVDQAAKELYLYTKTGGEDVFL